MARQAISASGNSTTARAAAPFERGESTGREHPFHDAGGADVIELAHGAAVLLGGMDGEDAKECTDVDGTTGTGTVSMGALNS
jgi:hypothetical protein